MSKKCKSCKQALPAPTPPKPDPKLRSMFRVWNKETRKYLRWDSYLLWPTGELVALLDRKCADRFSRMDPDTYEIEWCLGDTDKEGTPIYEADIVDGDWHDPAPVVVKRIDYHWGFVRVFPDRDVCYIHSPQFLKVIGNTHEPKNSHLAELFHQSDIRMSSGTV